MTNEEAIAVATELKSDAEYVVQLLSEVKDKDSLETAITRILDFASSARFESEVNDLEAY